MPAIEYPYILESIAFGATGIEISYVSPDQDMDGAVVLAARASIDMTRVGEEMSTAVQELVEAACAVVDAARTAHRNPPPTFMRPPPKTLITPR